VINNARLLNRPGYPGAASTPSGGGGPGVEWEKKCELLELRLVQRNDEIKKLKSEVELLQTDDAGSGIITELKQKLLELTKRNRRITVTNETLKSKVKELEQVKRVEQKEVESKTLALLKKFHQGWVSCRSTRQSFCRLRTSFSKFDRRCKS
jgi:hypothetical protein